MTCEPQPSAGDSATAAIDYDSATKDYAVQARVFGQSNTDNWVPPTWLTSNLILDEEEGLRASEARPVGQPFYEVRSGSGNFPVLLQDETDDPLRVDFSVENPSLSHSLMGFGYASITIDYTTEYKNRFEPLLRIDGVNTATHLLALVPLNMGAADNNYGEVGTFSHGGMSLTVPFGPNGPIDPGTSWADTINFSILGAGAYDLLQTAAEPADNTTDPPTPAKPATYSDQARTMTVTNWEVRVSGMIF